MKKILAIYLLIFSLLLTGCSFGNKNPNGTNTENTQNTESAQNTEGSEEADESGDSNVGGDAGNSGNAGNSGSGSSDKNQCKSHKDDDYNDLCDKCGVTLLVYVDFYSVNDLHGKLADGTSHPGVDELSTYLMNKKRTDDYMFMISPGDMWQGSAESNLTNGKIMTDWMNEMGFTAMALGNHEYDWGEDAIKENYKIADFPFLAINIYDKSTNKLVDYCKPSVVVKAGDLKIGIIGAMGDCYSSISPDKVKGVYFKVGDDLTKLVKEESERLRNQGVDCIVYMIHDGYGNSNASGMLSSSQLKDYYDVSLSGGYVDLVFEGHTHQQYVFQDSYGVYHVQHRGDNYGGISHVEIAVNSVTNMVSVTEAKLVKTSEYTSLSDHPIVQQLLKKYDAVISPANEEIGTNGKYRRGDELRQIVADLYYKAGVERWGNKYDIALGGGFISVRSPYNLSAGPVTYSVLQSLFPFDNDLVLCSIKGRDLLSRFFNSTHEDYFISYGSYGESIKNNIDPNGTYYVIVDTYSSQYAPNRLTEIERYDSGVYARDLLAEFVKNGGLK